MYAYDINNLLEETLATCGSVPNVLSRVPEVRPYYTVWAISESVSTGSSQSSLYYPPSSLHLNLKSSSVSCLSRGIPSHAVLPGAELRIVFGHSFSPSTCVCSPYAQLVHA